MKWKDEYATGIPRIDEQHKTLFQIAEQFQLTLNHGGGENIYETLLNFLDSYCQNHFHFEERCMTEYNCPTAQKNKDAHAHFLEFFKHHQQHYKTHGYQANDAFKLIETLEQWLDKHICGIDSHLKNCVHAKQANTPDV